MFKISEIYATNELHKTLQLKEILNMSHRSTLFSQILSFIPRHVFQKLEHRHKAGRASRKFGFKEQFTVMAFLQLAARRSMRDGIRALSAAGKKLYHWGLTPVARSTFADANNTRPVGFFKDVFAEMYRLCAHQAPRHTFRFKCKLYSMDATVISLCLSLFPWAAYRHNKGGVKINTVLDHDGYIPAFADISNASKIGMSVQQIFQIVLFGFQIKCSILFGEPQAGKSPPAPHKTCGFGACLAGAMPIPDKIEAIFIWNWHYSICSVRRHWMNC